MFKYVSAKTKETNDSTHLQHRHPYLGGNMAQRAPMFGRCRTFWPGSTAMVPGFYVLLQTTLYVLDSFWMQLLGFFELTNRFQMDELPAAAAVALLCGHSSESQVVFSKGCCYLGTSAFGGPKNDPFSILFLRQKSSPRHLCCQNPSDKDHFMAIAAILCRSVHHCSCFSIFSVDPLAKFFCWGWP